MNGTVCSVCHREDAALTQKDRGVLAPGTKLDDGSVIIGAKIGRGGFGITYHALDTISGKHVVVKEFMPNYLVTRAEDGIQVAINNDAKEDYDNSLRSFHREARVINELRNHPNIVNILFTIEENNTAYYGMEFLEGETLSQYAKKQSRKFSAKEAAELLLPIMDALIFCHDKSVYHRDVSPDNIFLSRSENGKIVPKLIDFGAAYVAMRNFTRIFPNVRKQCYSPYEQMTSSEGQGSWSDVYSFAATMYYLITGHPPVSALEIAGGNARIVPPREEKANISEKAEHVLMHALAFQAAERIKTMRDFRREMCEALNIEVPKIVEPPPVPDPGPKQDSKVTTLGENDNKEPEIPAPVSTTNDMPVKAPQQLAKRAALYLIQAAVFYGLGYMALGLPGLLAGYGVFVLFETLMVSSGGHASIGMNSAGLRFVSNDSDPSLSSSLIFALLNASPLVLLDAVRLKNGETPLADSSSGLQAVPVGSVNVFPASTGRNEQEGRAILLCVEGTMKGKRFPVLPDHIAGRNGEMSQIPLDSADITVSRRHCRFVYMPGGQWGIVNLSGNGVNVDGKQIQEVESRPVPLKNGSRIGIGMSTFEFHIQKAGE